MKVPNYYQKIGTMPTDPQGCECYAVITDNMQAIMKVFPILVEKSMGCDAQAVIKGVHSSLYNDQGLVECEIGKTKNGLDCVYTIIKTKLEPSGIQYFLRLHLLSGKKPYEFNAFAEEIGMTGIRETMVGEYFARNNMEIEWKDPYDEKFTKGFLMNSSEDKKFDVYFQDHPLTELRRVIKFITENY